MLWCIVQSIKGTAAWESVTSGSSDPVLIPTRFCIQSASVPSELSIYQARLIWDAAALRLLGSYRSQRATSFPHPCCKLPLKQHAVIVVFFISSSELPLCALCSSLVSVFHPTGSCSSASGETILECANVSKMFLDTFETKEALQDLLLYYYSTSTETFKAWVLSWQGWLGKMLDVVDALKKVPLCQTIAVHCLVGYQQRHFISSVSFGRQLRSHGVPPSLACCLSCLHLPTAS